MMMQEENKRTNHSCRRWLARLLIVALAIGTVLPLQTQSASAASDTTGKVTLTEVSKSGKVLSIKWEAVSGVSGYQVQYADNRLFLDKISKDKDAETTAMTVKDLSADAAYYVRIRSYVTSGKNTTYSVWTMSDNVYKGKEITRTPVYKELLSKLELRRAAKQKVPGYDTVQGSCYGNGYAYFVLENRNVKSSGKRCKIIKVNLKTKKVVKVSKGLKLNHGNDMTFDTKRNRLVVAHSTPLPKKVSIVNPNTLKVTGTATVQLPDSIEGISKKTLKSYKKSYNGFGAIAYNSKHDQFVVCLRGTSFHHLMVLDKNFNPVRFIWLPKEDMIKQMLQTVDSVGDFIMVGQSYGYGYTGNNIVIYDWYQGDYLSKLTLGTTYEMEGVFHADGKLYCSYYTSYYKKGKLQRDNFIYLLTDL